jgi:hypothetical protein
MGQQCVGCFAHFLQELLVREAGHRSWFIAFKDDSRLVTPLSNVAVNALVGNIKLATREPFNVACFEIPAASFSWK